MQCDPNIVDRCLCFIVHIIRMCNFPSLPYSSIPPRNAERFQKFPSCCQVGCLKRVAHNYLFRNANFKLISTHPNLSRVINGRYVLEIVFSRPTWCLKLPEGLRCVDYGRKSIFRAATPSTMRTTKIIMEQGKGEVMFISICENMPSISKDCYR